MRGFARSTLEVTPGGALVKVLRCPTCSGVYREDPDELKVRQQAAQGQGRDLYLTRAGSPVR